MTTWRTSPSVAWVLDSIWTLFAPALCPMMVMLLGSPPKAAMLSWTHCKAHSWS